MLLVSLAMHLLFAGAAAFVARGETLTLRATDFGPTYPFVDIWNSMPIGTQQSTKCGRAGVEPTPTNLAKQNCFVASDEPWLAEQLPMWEPDAGSAVTWPFVRNVSLVRFLGGLAQSGANGTYLPQLEFDFVSRDDAGALVYDWATRVDVAFDGLVAARVTPRPVVLDNLPYALVNESDRYFGKYGGLYAGPSNATEYGQFVEAFVAHLVERYGVDEVNRWSFRVGTEADGSRYGADWRLQEDPEPDGKGGTLVVTDGVGHYIPVYEAAARAIKRHAPLAAVGPCNFARSTDPVVSAGMARLADYVFANEVPVDFAALSSYGSQHEPSGEDRVAEIQAVVEFARRATGGTRELPVEVHEFGVSLDRTFVKGAFAGAWAVAAWLWQLGAGASRIFHWGFHLDRTISDTARLVTGWGFSLASMHLLVGSGGGLGARAVRKTEVGSSPGSFGAFRVAHAASKELMYLVVVHSDNPETGKSRNKQVEVQLRIAAADFPEGKAFWDFDSVSVTQRVLNASSSVLDSVRNHLQAAGGYSGGLLKTNDPLDVDFVGSMATTSGMQQVSASISKYLEMSQGSLQASEFDGSIEFGGSELVLSFTARTPAVHLFTLSDQAVGHFAV